MEWCTPKTTGEYLPVAEAQHSVVSSRGASSKQKHKSMTKAFEDFSVAPGVNPRVVTSVSDFHLANIYRVRLREFTLMEATQNAISAAMTDYFNHLGCVGRWQTGRDASGNVTFSGHPNKDKERDRWSTMAAYMAYLAVCNRLQKHFVDATPMAAMVDIIQKGAAASGSEIRAMIVAIIGKMK